MKKSEERTQQLQSIQAKMDAIGPAYQDGSRKAYQEMIVLTEEYKQTYRERVELKKQEQKG